jgi:hypothetical protein
MTETNGCIAGKGNDTIQFSVSGTILLASTLPEVDDSQLTINGPALPGVTISGGDKVQVMDVGIQSILNLKNLTIAHGFDGLGGGIASRGTLTIINSTFSGNSADDGGGILNDSGGRLTITNSTLSGNSASPVGNGAGGGIFNSASMAFKSTVLARSGSGGNCFNSFAATITDAGYNISDDDSCGFSATGSQNNRDPMLDLVGLNNNGGPTQTIALLSGSPAIDAIPLAECTDQASPPNQLTTDQRGFPRPDAGEGVCDIGAYEFQDFAGDPGEAKCYGESISALSKHYRTLPAAASAMGFRNIRALQNAIRAFCKG